MDFKAITSLLSDPSERAIIIEDGKPVCVVMGIEAYTALKGNSQRKEEPANPLSSPTDTSEVNAQLEEERLKARELAARLAMDASTSRPEPVEPSRIRLEDLPL